MFRFYKNLVLTIFGIAFFILYYSPEYEILKSYLLDNVGVTDVALSHLSATIGFFASIGLIGLLNRGTEYIIKYMFRNNNAVLYTTDFVVRFVAITKYIVGFYVFSYFAILSDKITDIANKSYSIALIVVLLFFTTSFVNHFFSHDLIQKTKLKALGRTLLPFVNKIIVIFIWIIGIITIFDNLGYDISALIAGAGIGGLAIAFAAQKSISNVFGAITILLNKPFKIGDYVTVNGINGTVKDIGLSYLTIIDRQGHQVMIPNEAIISTNVENFSVRKNRRTDFGIGVIYGTTQEKMKKGVSIIEEILEEYVVDETISSYRVNFDMFGDFSLNLQITYFSLINDSYKGYLKQKEEINMEIKKRFKTARIDMAFPTQELIIKKED